MLLLSRKGFVGHTLVPIFWQVQLRQSRVRWTLVKDIEEGQQVFINYSDREDDEMLMHYGFSFPPNVNKHSFLEVNKEELR